MKELLLNLMEKEGNPVQKVNLAREYIQALSLRSLHESQAFQNISFVGGTALRFLYDLPRFSEDLDFSLENNQNYEPEKWLKKLKQDLIFSNYNVTITFNNKKTVHTAWIKIPEILFEAGLAGKKEENLSIKLEIDSNPPSGALTEISLLNKHFVFAVHHHSLDCLMAGKIRALLTRTFTKGRDWYDLLWYLSKRPPVSPNQNFLDKALQQGNHLHSSAKNWQELLLEQVQTANWDLIIKDVEPFLENPKETALLNAQNFTALLNKIC